MRLNQNNPAVWMGVKRKAFESAMGCAGTAFRGFHAGRFRLGGPWGEGSGTGEDEDERAESWKAMLEALFGEVPEGEETPPPCDFLMMPEETVHRYCGVPAQLPPAAGRVEDFPFPVRNQFERGACFAFAMTALCEHGFAKRGRKTALSEQSLYCFTKQETRVEVDEQRDGVEHLRDAVRAVEKWGVAPLEMWPYDPNADGWNFVNYAGDCAALVQAASAFRWGYWKAFRGNSVAELKEWLAKGHPVCIGAHTTPAWQAGAAESDGTIPYFPQHWKLLLDKASAVRAAEAINEAAGDCSEDDEAEDGGEDEDSGEQGPFEALLAKMRQEEKNTSPADLLKETQDRLLGLLNTYTGQPVMHGDWKDDGPVVSVPIALEATGGHAVCLLGYQDDEDWAGGGYFVARNSWGEGWGWPEHPGHGRIPYEYMAQMGLDAYVMLYEAGTDILPGTAPCGAVPSGGTAGGMRTVAGTGGPEVDDFGAWLAARTKELPTLGRDLSGWLLDSGTSVLVPDLSHPKAFFRDTPENREKLRRMFKEDMARRTAEQEAEDAKNKAEAEAAALARQRDEVMPIVDASLDRLIPPDHESISEGLARRFPELPRPPREWIVEAMHELVAKHPGRYRIARSFDGRVEEIHKNCKD